MSLRFNNLIGGSNLVMTEKKNTAWQYDISMKSIYWNETFFSAIDTGLFKNDFIGLRNSKDSAKEGCVVDVFPYN